MHIAVVARSFPARSETFVVEHAVGLATRGHSVTVISGPAGADISSQEIERVRRVAQIENSEQLTGSEFFCALRFIRNVFLLKGIGIRKKLTIFKVLNRLKVNGKLSLLNSLLPILGKNYDIAHVHFGVIAVPIVMLRDAKLFHGDVVVTWHGYDANQVPQLYGKAIYRNLFLRKAIHTVGSKFMWMRLLELGAPEQSLRKVSMGIDLDFFRLADKREPEVAPLKILSVGRLVEVKGHEYLIAAVFQLIKQGQNVQLMIIGEGYCRPHLEILIRELELEGRVILVGAQDRSFVRNAMWTSHIFALTGVHAKDGSIESQGVVFSEAQACGLPVIASDVGGVSESVLDGETGILCAPCNVEQIASAIKHFIRNHEDINKYGVAARRYVELNYSNQQMLRSFERIYDDVCRE
jgi:colanic acid/amylovoran biosynthesis glycosyltransferase